MNLLTTSYEIISQAKAIDLVFGQNVREYYETNVIPQDPYSGETKAIEKDSLCKQEIKEIYVLNCPSEGGMMVSVTDGFDKNSYIDLYYVLLANKKEDGTDILVDVDFAKFAIYKGIEYQDELKHEKKRIIEKIEDAVNNTNKTANVASNIPSMDHIYTVYVNGEYHICVKKEYGNVAVYKKINVTNKHEFIFVNSFPLLTVTKVSIT